MNIELFQTVAEVSITFTGLAGIASILGHSTLDADIKSWRVQNMILTSLMAFFLSLVPMAAALLEVPDDTTWRTASALLIAAQLAQAYFANRVSVAARVHGGIRAFWAVGTLTILALQISNVAGIVDPGAAFFFIGLCWLMFLASLHFFVLIMSAQFNR